MDEDFALRSLYPAYAAWESEDAIEIDPYEIAGMRYMQESNR